MGKKLYIIGNGFDLHFGLPTLPRDFEDIFKTKRSYDGYNAADVISGYGVNWGDYEGSLAEFDVDELAYENIVSPDYTSDHERDRDYGITNIEYYLNTLGEVMRESLKEMVSNANNQISNVLLTNNDKRLIDTDSKIISFNYTSTIERFYRMNCFHIHGFYENGDELVFGYKEELESGIDRELKSDLEEDHDYYIDTQKEMILDFYKSLKKKLKLTELKDYLMTIDKIDEVVVMGHSMSDVDAPYFELIEETIKPAKWMVYWHNDVPDYKRYSFADRVDLKEW